MSQRRWTLLGLLLASSAVAAGEEVALPSDPQTWYGDLRPMITPTEQCPGGTVEQLRKRMSVSEPSSTRALDTAQRFSQSTLPGIEDSDLVHEFHFSSELAGGGFWGFSGYLISRGECIIHAKVTSIDN